MLFISGYLLSVVCLYVVILFSDKKLLSGWDPEFCEELNRCAYEEFLNSEILNQVTPTSGPTETKLPLLSNSKKIALFNDRNSSIK